MTSREGACVGTGEVYAAGFIVGSGEVYAAGLKDGVWATAFSANPRNVSKAASKNVVVLAIIFPSEKNIKLCVGEIRSIKMWQQIF
jgi:hypothetical protein